VLASTRCFLFAGVGEKKSNSRVGRRFISRAAKEGRLERLVHIRGKAKLKDKMERKKEDGGRKRSSQTAAVGRINRTIGAKGGAIEMKCGTDPEGGRSVRKVNTTTVNEKLNLPSGSIKKGRCGTVGGRGKPKATNERGGLEGIPIPQKIIFSRLLLKGRIERGEKGREGGAPASA